MNIEHPHYRPQIDPARQKSNRLIHPTPQTRELFPATIIFLENNLNDIHNPNFGNRWCNNSFPGNLLL